MEKQEMEMKMETEKKMETEMKMEMEQKWKTEMENWNGNSCTVVSNHSPKLPLLV